MSWPCTHIYSELNNVKLKAVWSYCTVVLCVCVIQLCVYTCTHVHMYVELLVYGAGMIYRVRPATKGEREREREG